MSTPRARQTAATLINGEARRYDLMVSKSTHDRHPVPLWRELAAELRELAAELITAD